MYKKSCLLIIVLLFLVFGVTAWSLSSHKDYATMIIKECTACHQSSGVAPNHGSFWTSEHRLYAEKRPNNCQDCHEQSFCLDCHTGGGIDRDLHTATSGANYMPKSHRTDFREIHPIKAQDDPRSCYRCHDAEKFCASCHSRFPKGSLQIRSHQQLGDVGQRYWTMNHRNEARRNLQSCQTCHPDGDVCIQCHSSGKVSPHPRNWKPRNSQGRSGKTCLKCHIPGTF